MTKWLLWLLLLAPSFVLDCSGTVSGRQEEPMIDAGLDGSGGDDADAGLEDAGVEDGGVEDGDVADGGEEDGGQEDAGGDPGPERCAPLADDPPLPACPAAGWTAFASDGLLLLDAPSMASAGSDFVLELSAQGALVQTVISAGEGIVGASDIALDPLSGHLFLSVSYWPDQVFEVREFDADGGLLATIPMPAGLNGGNIALAFDAQGTLYAAYDTSIFKREAGGNAWIDWAEIPDGMGLGEIALDRRGNVYLTDPFVCECVLRYAPDGSHCTLAGPEDGLESPYGLAVTADDLIFVTGYDPWGGGLRVDRIDGPGRVSIYADDLASADQSMRGLDTDPAGQLYATIEGGSPAVIKVNADGTHTLFSDPGIELGHPARIISVGTPYPCE